MADVVVEPLRGRVHPLGPLAQGKFSLLVAARSSFLGEPEIGFAPFAQALRVLLLLQQADRLFERRSLLPLGEIVSE